MNIYMFRNQLLFQILIYNLEFEAIHELGTLNPINGGFKI